MCVQSEASGVLWQVGGVGVDQSSAPSILLSQPDLLSEADSAPDTHHHHTANHRHARALQPIKILRTAVVGVDHAPLQRDRQVRITGAVVTMETKPSCLSVSPWYFPWRCMDSSQTGSGGSVLRSVQQSPPATESSSETCRHHRCFSHTASPVEDVCTVYTPVGELQRGVQRLGPGVIHLQLPEATEDL